MRKYSILSNGYIVPKPIPVPALDLRQQCAAYEFNERWIQVARQAYDCHGDEVEHVRKTLAQDWIQQITNPR